MVSHTWSVAGSLADSHMLRETLALERQDRKKRSMREYERRDEERNGRKVGIAIRKAVREQQGHGRRLHVRPKPVRRARDAGRRAPRFEIMTGMLTPRPSHVGGDGYSSFHFKWTCRGLGRHRQSSHRFRGGETVRHLRYIMREAAREQVEGAIVSNISRDPETVAGLFSAIEELERYGRANANVYIGIVVSMPHELESSERAALLAQICAIFGRHDLPHAGVLHDADERGDQRNKHAHIMSGLRPFRREADGSFSLSAGTCAELNDATTIKAIRSEIAELMNAAMQRAGHGRRFTAKSNAERGLAPRTKKEGKSTPGAKHRERRADRIGQMRNEVSFTAERIEAWSDVQTQLVSMITAPPLDRAAILAEARDRVADRARITVQHHAVATSQPREGVERAPATNAVPATKTPDRKPLRSPAVSGVSPHPPAPPPPPPFDMREDRKKRRQAAVDEAVDRICRPAQSSGAGETIRAALRPLIRKIGESTGAGWLSFRLDGDTLIAGTSMPSLLNDVDAVLQRRGGYDALRLIAKAMTGFEADPSHRHTREISPEARRMTPDRLDRPRRDGPGIG